MHDFGFLVCETEATIQNKNLFHNSKQKLNYLEIGQGIYMLLR